MVVDFAYLSSAGFWESLLRGMPVGSSGLVNHFAFPEITYQENHVLQAIPKMGKEYLSGDFSLCWSHLGGIGHEYYAFPSRYRIARPCDALLSRYLCRDVREAGILQV